MIFPGAMLSNVDLGRNPTTSPISRIAGACVFAGLLIASIGCRAVEVTFKPVADGVYAYVGDTGPRNADNEGLNANIGLVVTPAGSVLIDSGPTLLVARKIDEAVRRVTSQPVRWVINTGGQDHRWFGNGYFKSAGAEIIGHAKGRADMESRGGDQATALRSLLGEKFDGTVLTLPTRLIDRADARLEFGGRTFELRNRGGGHTPGDMIVWLPSSNVLFAGDIVYVDRLPAIIGVSNTRHWLDAFDVIAQIAPHTIVPGHGAVTTLAHAAKHTQSYLRAMREHMKRAVDSGIDIGDAVRSFDAAPFRDLPNAGELLAGNGNRVYLELERE